MPLSCSGYPQRFLFAYCHWMEHPCSGYSCHDPYRFREVLYHYYSQRVGQGNFLWASTRPSDHHSHLSQLVPSDWTCGFFPGFLAQFWLALGLESSSGPFHCYSGLDCFVTLWHRVSGSSTLYTIGRPYLSTASLGLTRRVSYSNYWHL